MALNNFFLALGLIGLVSACFKSPWRPKTQSQVSTVTFELPKGNYSGYGVEVKAHDTAGQKSNQSSCSPPYKKAEPHDGSAASKSIEFTLKNGCSYLLVINLGDWDPKNPAEIKQPRYSNRYEGVPGTVIPASELVGGTIEKDVTVVELSNGQALPSKSETNLNIHVSVRGTKPPPPQNGFQSEGKKSPPTENPNPSINQPLVFVIRAGTGTGAWNDEGAPLIAKAGETLVIENQDDVPHQVHTGEWKEEVAPFPHGKLLRKGERQSFVLKAYDGPPLMDHLNPETGKFYLKVTP